MNQKKNLSLQFANRIYLFCKEINKGIMFYDQSPTGVVTKLIGSLPSGKYWSSGERFVEWDERINGKRYLNLPVDNHISLMTNKQKRFGRTSNGNISSFFEITIIISAENMYKLLQQLKNPVINSNNDYKVLDLNSEVVDFEIQNILTPNEDNNSSVKK